MSMLLFTSCELETHPVIDPGDGGVIEHSEDITSNEIWSNKNIHLVTDLIEVKNATLSIEAGTIVKFKERAGLSFGYYETPMSKLIALGEEGKEIVFQSAHASVAWDNIVFGRFNSEESIIDHCIFENGGGDSQFGLDYQGTIKLESTAITFTNNVVRNSENFGIYADTESRFIRFTGNTITRSGKSSVRMGLQWAHTVGMGNQIDNDGYGILLEGDFNHKSKVVWRKHTCPYTLDTDISDRLNGTLEIEAGTIIQMANRAQLYMGDIDDVGDSFTLIAKGTPSERIVFKPASESGAWETIYLSFGVGEDCLFEYCDFIGGGLSSYATMIIDLKTLKPTIRNCNIAGYSAGLYIYNDPYENVLPHVENVTYSGNEGMDVEYAYDDGLKLEEE